MRSLVAALACLLLLVTSPASAGMTSCAVGASPASTTARHMTLHNASAATRRIYWMDFTGMRQRYADLAPGQSWEVDTYVGHNWQIADSTDRCLYGLVVDPTMVVVDLP